MDRIIEINGERYVNVARLVELVTEFLIDRASGYYIATDGDEEADTISEFLVSVGEIDLAKKFESRYIERRMEHLKGHLDAMLNDKTWL